MNMTVIANRPEHRQLVIHMNMAVIIPVRTQTVGNLDEHDNNYT